MVHWHLPESLEQYKEDIAMGRDSILFYAYSDRNHYPPSPQMYSVLEYCEEPYLCRWGMLGFECTGCDNCSRGKRGRMRERTEEGWVIGDTVEEFQR